MRPALSSSGSNRLGPLLAAGFEPVFALCALLLTAGCDPAPMLAPEPLTPVPATGITAFVDVTVLPMTGPETVPAQTVVVNGEVIEAMGPTASVAIPAGARVVDGRGRFLMPGLTDLHSHLGTNYSEFTNRTPPPAELQAMAEGQLLLYLAAGVTTILGNGDFVEPVVRWGREVREGRYPGPTVSAAMFARGPTGTPDGGPAGRAVTGAAQAVSHVAAARTAGFGFMKLYNWTPADAVPAIIQAAHGAGMGVIGHLPQTLPAATTLQGGLDMVTHLEAFLWRFFGHQVQPDRVPELIALVGGSGTYVTTTLDMSATVAQVWGGNAGGIAAFWARPENRYMHWTEVALHRESIEGPRWRPAGSMPGELDERLQFVREYSRALYDAAVPLQAGTDAPSVLGVAGFSLHRELAELRESLGLTPYQVLEIATRNGGEFIGRFAQGGLLFGTVATGRRADLLLLSANPLDDLANLNRRVAVMARGRLYEESGLQAGLETLAQRYRGVCCPH